MNPSGEISTGNIYDLSRVREYENICDVIHKEVPPHIFAVAARAHYRIIQGLGKPSQVNPDHPGDLVCTPRAYLFLSLQFGADTSSRRFLESYQSRRTLITG